MEKEVFISNGTREEMKKFSQILEEKFGIKSRVDTYIGKYLLYVDENDYLEALSKGSLLAEEMGLNFSWLDKNNTLQPLGYIPVMYQVLPESRTGEHSWNYPYDYGMCHLDIKKYVEELKEFLDGKEVLISYNRVDNAFTIYVKSSFMRYNIVNKQCRGFQNVKEYTPFTETYFLNWDNTLDIDFHEIKVERKRKMRSYFDNSLVIDGLKYPEGSNIVLDDTKEKSNGNDDFYCSSRNYGGEQLLININHEESIKCHLVLEGKFNVYEEKEFHKRKSNKLINRCSIRDIGTFKSNVESTTDTVTIITDIDVDRKVDGDNLDKKSVRDGVLINISPETCKETTTIKEYYKLIENGTRLLHYSDNSTFFEIFDLPKNWFIEDGINKLGNPKVFDNWDYDKDDISLEEALNIMGKKEEVKVLSKNDKNL